MSANPDPSGHCRNDRRRSLPNSLTLIVGVVIVFFFSVACDPDGQEDPPPDNTETGPEVSLATNAETTMEETTSVLDQYADEATSGENTTEDEPDAVVRLEGEEGTRFTGICSVGDERNVLSGEVPRRFEFRLDGKKLSCVIQKRTSSGGSLRVILVSGGETRSVQQTGEAGGEVRISFSSDST